MMMGNWWFILVLFMLLIGSFILLSDGLSITKKEESPLSILDRRYANGEIDDDEYTRRKNLLNKKE